MFIFLCIIENDIFGKAYLEMFHMNHCDKLGLPLGSISLIEVGVQKGWVRSIWRILEIEAIYIDFLNLKPKLN